jgi:two-component system, NtrC family, response regulator HydG
MSESNLKLKILVIDDNEAVREGILQTLLKDGHSAKGFSDGESAAAAPDLTEYDAVITDYKMAGINGLDLLKKIKSRCPEIEVIMITAYGSIELAVNAMKEGAWDFLTKPFNGEELRLKIERLAKKIFSDRQARQLADENEYYRSLEAGRFNYSEIIGESPAIKEVYAKLKKIAASDTSVYISGESGTGKELVARAVHNDSARRDKPFVTVNCAALAEGVLESELFGHEKGAFTGALKAKKGRFELAHNGTLFLDEIGDIPPATQVKLLRVIQEKNFERVGGENTIHVDVRIITATNRDLAKEIKTGRFREDLLYRLYVLPVHLPPLRQRKEDIPLLARHFLAEFAKTGSSEIKELNQGALTALAAYHWPGNIRELRNVLERAFILSSGSVIAIEDLHLGHFDQSGTELAHNGLNLNARLDELEKELLEQAMKAAEGVKARAARLLGIKESALYYKLEKFNMI